MKQLDYVVLLERVCLTFLISILLFSCQKIENTTYEELKNELEAENSQTEEREIIESTLNLSQFIAEVDELSLVQEALNMTDLKKVLNSEGPITLFAPTNAAVDGLFMLLGDTYDGFDDFDTVLELEILNRILSYHVVNGNLTSDVLTDGELPTLYEDNSIEILRSSESFLINDASDVDAKPIAIDKKATNGVLHIIDKILVPQDVIAFLGNPNPSNTAEKTIKEIVIQTRDFTFFKEALEIAGLFNVLDEDGPFTVFAPTNNTLLNFIGLLGDEYDSLQDFTTEEEIAVLKEILLYHLLGGKLKSEDFTLRELSTFSGENTIRIRESEEDFALVDGLGRSVNFNTTDIPAKNGVIHAIDRIMIPESVVDHIENEVMLAFEEAMIATGNLNTALQFFKRIQDDMDLKGLIQKDFTFFFPSDKAFADLFIQIGAENTLNLNEEENSELLQILLSYHCVQNVALKSENFLNGQHLDTFHGEQLQARISNDFGVSILDKKGQPSQVILTDQKVLNGVIHVVDKILIPEEVLINLGL